MKKIVWKKLRRQMKNFKNVIQEKFNIKIICFAYLIIYFLSPLLFLIAIHTSVIL